MTRNLWHSCSRYPLSHHFKNKQPIVRELFDEFLALVATFGPVTVISQKTRIAFQVRVRFASVVTRSRWLNCALWLKRRAAHPIFYKIEQLGTRDHIHSFRLRSIDDLHNKDLKALLREGYRIGCQEQPAGEQRTRSRMG